MKFEDIIKRTSAVLAGIVVYFFIAGFYLNSKGFEYDASTGDFIVKQANAAETSSAIHSVPLNFAFPQDHILGNRSAPVTLYEYSSFGCSHCADFHLEVLPKIIKKYINEGKVRAVFVPLPLEKNSMNAALLAECVAPNKYFSFAEVLFKKQRDWSIAFDPQKVLIQLAALSGVSNDKATACLKDDIMAARILKDRETGLKELKISGTPSFIVSSSKRNDMVYGYHDFDFFDSLIEEHLEN